MKPLFVSMLLAGLATLWISTSAQASPQDPGVDARQHHQQQRIAQGVRSGELTAAETRRLEREKRHIRREERRYMAAASCRSPNGPTCTMSLTGRAATFTMKNMTTSDARHRPPVRRCAMKG